MSNRTASGRPAHNQNNASSDFNWGEFIFGDFNAKRLARQEAIRNGTWDTWAAQQDTLAGFQPSAFNVGDSQPTLQEIYSRGPQSRGSNRPSWKPPVPRITPENRVILDGNAPPIVPPVAAPVASPGFPAPVDNIGAPSFDQEGRLPVPNFRQAYANAQPAPSMWDRFKTAVNTPQSADMRDFRRSGKV